MRRTILYRFTSVHISAGIFVLENIIVECLVIRFLTKQDLVAVKIHQIGMRLIVEGKGVCLVVYPYLMPVFIGAVIDIDGHRQSEDLPCFLCLMDDHLDLLVVVIVDIVDRQLRMTAAVVPLIPIPVK